MSPFTRDWSASRTHWPEMLEEFAGRPRLRFLEIGCFEGHATLWLLQHVLTDPSSRITVIDPWSFPGQYDRFAANVRPHRPKVDIRRGRSQDVLRYLDLELDFVYVDGSHRPADVLTDAVLSWRLLRPGGLLCFDDYGWDEDLRPAGDNVEVAVDAFVACFDAEILDAREVGPDQYLVVKR